MSTEAKPFKVFAPTLMKDTATTLNDDGTLTITGVASTTNRDLDGDIVTSEAIESLKAQVVGLNLHLDHNHHYDGGIGAITGATVEDNSLIITAVVLPEYAQGIKDRLDLGMNFGFSIGGIPDFGVDYTVITDFKLLEVSLTLLPANWDTFGTVESKGFVESTCLTGACHYIMKDLNGDKMRTKATEEGANSGLTEDQVIALINEAFAENSQNFIDEIRDELTAIVNEAVDAKLEELKPTEPAEEGEGKSEEDLIDEEGEVKESTTEPVEEVKSGEEPVDEEDKSNTTEPVEDNTEKMVNQIVNDVFKKLNENRDVKNSKFDKYNETSTKKKSTFLDSETRDKFGRNKKYL